MTTCLSWPEAVVACVLAACLTAVLVAFLALLRDADRRGPRREG